MKLARRLALVATVCVLATAPAAAQDQGGPGKDEPAPGPGKEEKPAEPAAAAPAKKERSVDPKAQEVYDRYRKLLAIPATSGVKELSTQAEMFPMQLGGERLGIKLTWKAEGGLSYEFDLPESVKAQFGDQLAMVEQQLSMQLGQFIGPFFDDPTAQLAKYNLAAAEEGGKTVVTLTPFEDRAPLERGRFTVGADGLPEQFVVAPKGNANNPMTGGQDIVVSFKHAKRGERFVLSNFGFTLPFGEFTAEATYVDGPNALPLLRTLALANPMQPEADLVTFYDYVVDGKPVESTAKPKAEKKPEETKPAEPKPEEKKPEAPAPGPEAPK